SFGTRKKFSRRPFRTHGKSPLPAVAVFQFSVDAIVHADLIDRPIRRDGDRTIGLARKAVDNDAGIQLFEKINHQIDVFVSTKERHFSLSIELLEYRALDDVKVV